MSSDVTQDVANTYPEPPSSICSTGPNLFVLNGALLTLIRRHFADPAGIVDPDLRNYVWTDGDGCESNIMIEPIYKWDATKIQQRPGVVVKRGQWKTQRLGIGDRHLGPPKQVGYTEFEHVILMQGTHTFFCLGNSGLEAEKVGQEVAFELLGFSEIIRQQFQLARFQLLGIDAVHRIEECQDHFVVPVNVGYGIQFNWEVLRQAPIWMRSLMSVEIKE